MTARGRGNENVGKESDSHCKGRGKEEVKEGKECVMKEGWKEEVIKGRGGGVQGWGSEIHTALIDSSFPV